MRAEYRATRGVEAEPAVVVPVLDLDEDTEIEDGVRSFVADAAAAGMRLDAYLAQAIPEISRARVQTADRGWTGAGGRRGGEGQAEDARRRGD